MNSVYFCSPTNSTTFTTCCSCAIGEEEFCPRCKQPVEGYESGIHHQIVKNNRFKIAFEKQKRGIFGQ